MGPNIFPPLDEFYLYVPDELKATIQYIMNNQVLSSSDQLGGLLRSLIAMAINHVPFGRDDFNGFAYERAKILQMFQTYAANPIVLGGDLHDSWAWTMYADGNITGNPVALNLGA